MTSELKKILVIDDDPSIQEILRIILERSGYQVYKAIDGEEAISQFVDIKPDLVISDISMPKGDGFNVAIVIRSKEEGDSRIPILLMSAFYDDVSNRENAERCGADSFLPKPFTRKQLLNAVGELLEVNHG